MRLLPPVTSDIALNLDPHFTGLWILQALMRLLIFSFLCTLLLFIFSLPVLEAIMTVYWVMTG